MRGLESDSGSGLKLVGCTAVVVVVVVGLLVAALAAILAVRDAVRADRDPARRAERATELVGALPAGYHAAGIFSLRGALEVVVLSTVDRREAALDPDADPRIVLLTFRRPSRLWRPFVDSGRDVREALSREGVEVRGRIEGGGEGEWAGVPTRWVAVDGPVDLPGGRELGGRSVLVTPRCEGRAGRLVVWQPATYPAVSSDERAAVVVDVLRPLEPCW